MQPISRRLFLVGSVSVVIAACSSDDSATGTSAGTTSPGSATTDAPSTSAGPATTAEATLPPTDTESTPDTTAETVPETEPGTAPPTDPPFQLRSDPFTLGVASGDPSNTSVVLWTRLALDPLAGGAMPPDDVEVTWEMSRDEGFAEIEHEGFEIATAAYAHSVHAIASPDPGDWYFRFHAAGFTSPVGVTRTAPAPGTTVDSLRFASASCQNYQAGFYVAHRDIAAQKPDFCVFLGDYIYEGGAAEVGVDENVRTHGTPEIRTLDEYRNRYGLYKSDPDLQAAHAVCPWFVTWDDHEVENNYAGLTPQDVADQPTFAERRQLAYQAWWEHQPVALPPPGVEGDYVIYRASTWGDLLGLSMLDTRQYRSDQACGSPELSTEPPCPETFDAARTMLGDEQEAWLFEQLHAQQTVWHMLGQQVVFGDVTLNGAVLNYDQWDGYPGQRNRIVQRFGDEQIPNVVVLTGDIHFAGTGTIRTGDRATGPSVGVEFVATSISSGGDINPDLTPVIKGFPFILDVELEHRGYILHTVTPAQWSAEYRMVESVKTPESPMFVHNTYVVDAGSNTVRFAQPV
jgi:alkaline phosphatase D